MKRVNNITVEELLVFGKKHIHSDHAKILLAELLQKNPLELLNYLEEVIPNDQVELYKKEVIALEEGKPLQYVLGHVNFFGNTFYIDERVLIPRFETEELVENTIHYIQKYFSHPVRIIDLGTGSGAIGITLSKKISTEVVDLIDISQDALEVCQKNCEDLGVKANVIQSDFFENVNGQYDVIISNPPYIKEEEEIEEIVKENEPSLALYGGKDGLNCYRKILNTITDHMKDKCLVAFEIGYEQKEELLQEIKKVLPNDLVEVKKDLSGKDRMLFIFHNLE